VPIVLQILVQFLEPANYIFQPMMPNTIIGLERMHVMVARVRLTEGDDKSPQGIYWLLPF
jgi:hypothetical protein